jgi:hypothetical protein
MDSSFLKQQAERCRTLAENADPFIKQRLLNLALRYDARSDSSKTRRTFGIPGSLLEARLQRHPDGLICSKIYPLPKPPASVRS